MKKFNFLYRILFASLIFSMACTDLSEVPYNHLSPDNFNKTKKQVEATVKGVYESLASPHDWRYSFMHGDVSTDMGIIPTRAGGWNSSGERNYHEHSWDAGMEYNRRVYYFYSTTIGKANFGIEVIQDKEKFYQEIAELRFLRAFAYLQMMDLFGNVPIVTTAVQDPNALAGNAPLEEQRAKVFQFVEEELLAVAEELPAKKDVDAGYYPRATQETAWGFLAKLYLNAEVYSGQARWADCITYCDKVIDSGAFSITSEYGSLSEAFRYDNQRSEENIFTSVKSSLAGGQSNALICNSLQMQIELSWKLQMPQNGWGGFSVMKSHYDKYDEDDYRRSLILYGPQFMDDGTPLYNGANRDGNGKPENGQFEITEVFDIMDAAASEGLKSTKYQVDPDQMSGGASNDVVILRYADILLSKAEALIRQNGIGAGDDLINQVRARNFETPKPLINAGLDEILLEREFEFSIEGHRRTDLIRFGKFINLDYKWKQNKDSFRKLYPIPLDEVDRNINLFQNPGY